MVVTLRDWTAQEVAALRSLPEADKAAVRRAVAAAEAAFAPLWTGYGDFEELLERMHRLLVIVEEKPMGEGIDKEDEATRLAVAEISKFNELIKVYNDLWSKWEGYLNMIQILKEPTSVLICQKWEKLKFLSAQKLIKFWEHDIDIKGKDVTKSYHSFVLDNNSEEGTESSNMKRDATIKVTSEGIRTSNKHHVSESATDDSDVKTLKKTVIEQSFDRFRPKSNAHKDEVENQASSPTKTEADTTNSQQITPDATTSKQTTKDTVLSDHQMIMSDGTSQKMTSDKMTSQQTATLPLKQTATETVTSQQTATDTVTSQQTTIDNVTSQQTTTDTVTTTLEEEIQTYAITAVADPADPECQYSLQQAIMLGILDQVTHRYVDPRTGHGVPIGEAINEGLIKIKIVNSEMVREERKAYGLVTVAGGGGDKAFAVLHVLDKDAKEHVSFKEALERGILSKERAMYQSGRDTQAIPIMQAIARGWVKARPITSASNLHFDPSLCINVTAGKVMQEIKVVQAFKSALK